MTQPPDSISRTFAKWSVGLTYDDLPPAVVDKVKAFTLMAIVAGLIGADDHHARAIVDLVTAEEPKADGATIFGDGAKVTRGAAALANCEVMHSAGLFDSYRMLTHPGPVLVAVALTNAELGANSAKDVITALAIGYEMHCRLAHDFIPAISAQGFRPAPLFATVGAAMVAAKLMKLDEDATVAAIAVAVNSCSGLFEGGRTGGGEMSVHSANAARQGTFAAVMASLKQFTGSEHVIEGPSGFYRAYAGRTGPTLTRVFDGPRDIDLATVTEGLGSTFRLLDVMFRMYFTAGYNQPVIDVIAELMEQHSIKADAIEEIVVSMNYYETRYPSPEFPRYPDASVPRPGSTQYFAAHSAVHGGYPVAGAAKAAQLAQDPAVRAMMDRVTLRGVYDHPLFSPNVLIRVTDGRAVAADYPYRRMVWDFDRLAVELRRCVEGIPGGQAKLDEVVATVRGLDELESVAPLFALAAR
jgi:2-methylcitrate dehydratase PrpD